MSRPHPQGLGGPAPEPCLISILGPLRTKFRGNICAAHNCAYMHIFCANISGFLRNIYHIIYCTFLRPFALFFVFPLHFGFLNPFERGKKKRPEKPKKNRKRAKKIPKRPTESQKAPTMAKSSKLTEVAKKGHF